MPASRRPLDKLLLYVRTARHLRWQQLVYRPLRRLQRRTPGPHSVAAPMLHAANMEAIAHAVAAWGSGDASARIARADAVSEHRFVFLNHEEKFDVIDWRKRHVSHLWTFNLHYFDYAVDLAWAFRETGAQKYVDTFQRLAGGWIASARDSVEAWEPYPVALRLVNWTYAVLLFGPSLESAFRAKLLASIYEQLRWLTRRIEWQYLGNHLQKNLHAVALTSLLFDDQSVRRWRVRALAHLWRQLDEQVAADGGHAERSPMYHAIFLADYLELVTLLRACGGVIPEHAEGRIRAMLGAYADLVAPDGALHLFNDSADGVAPSATLLETLAGSALNGSVADVRGVWALPDTGYFGFRDVTAGDDFIIDCGPPSDPHLPAHSHCDMLSFELRLRGVPLVVDSGVCGYDGDPLREYVRSTRAHNTLTIDHREQSEVWGTFRLARRARVLSARISEAPDGFVFDGSYQPYYAADWSHNRRVERAGSTWTFTDSVQGAHDSRLDAFVHLHPDCRVEIEGSAAEIRAGHTSVRLEAFNVDALALLPQDSSNQGWHCAQFGRPQRAPVLRLTIFENDSREFGFKVHVAGAAE